MLVTTTARRLRGDGGSTLVVVLIVMLVLSIGGLALATIVTNTTSGLARSRGTAQSRAAADAGVAAAVAQARRTGQFCSTSLLSADPDFTVVGTCSGDQVTFRSTGKGSDGATTRTDATFAVIPPSSPGTGADMIFFASTKFTQEVVSHAGVNGDLLSIVVPGGGFTCQAEIPGNIVTAGEFKTSGGCDVQGDVYANGRYNSQQTDTHIHGDLVAASTVTGTNKNAHVGMGTVDGDMTVGGDLNLDQGTVGKNLVVGGTLTKPGTVGGTITQNGAKPAPLNFAALGYSWFDYAYQLSDWPGFTEHKLTTTGSGPDTCSAFNSYPGSGWTNLSSLSTAGPIAIDARACPALSSNMGGNPVVTLSHDLVLAAGSFDLTLLKIQAAEGTDPHVWFVVDDAKTPGSTYCTSSCAENSSPDIPSAGGSIKINGTTIAEGVTAMAYTPGVVDVRGIDPLDEWRGALYGGSFNYGGGLQFWGVPIALPGQASGSDPTEGGSGQDGSLGGLLSQRDVP